MSFMLKRHPSAVFHGLGEAGPAPLRRRRRLQYPGRRARPSRSPAGGTGEGGRGATTSATGDGSSRGCGGCRADPVNYPLVNIQKTMENRYV